MNFRHMLIRPTNSIRFDKFNKISSVLNLARWMLDFHLHDMRHVPSPSPHYFDLIPTRATCCVLLDDWAVAHINTVKVSTLDL